jgi:hypothetical protein
MGVSARGAFLMSRAVVPTMKAQRARTRGAGRSARDS